MNGLKSVQRGGASSSPATAPTPAAPASAPTHGGRHPLLHQLWRVIHQQRIEVDAVRQNVVTDVATADGECVQAHGLFALERHLHLLEVRVHGDIDTSDGAIHYGSVL